MKRSDLALIFIVVSLMYGSVVYYLDYRAQELAQEAGITITKVK